MKVHLQYQIQPQGAPQAAFLQGDSLADWLPELERWGIDIQKLACYSVPKSLADRSPAGLLAILPSQVRDIAWGECMPCYLVSPQLVLPLHASLWPAMTAAELTRHLLFPIQFLHPTLGMIGWELQERMDFGQILGFPPASTQAWNFAHPGNATSPQLNEVKVPQPSMEEAIQALKDGVNPIEQDPNAPKADDSPWSRFMLGILKGGLSMTKGISDAFPEGKGEPGAFSQLADWLGGKVSGLQSQRENAIDKLLDMFEKNFDEALRYAIPLGNPFADRGMGAAGGSLSERNPQFNFGNIGGGLGGNAWNIGAQRQQMLRERYLKAANEAIARGDFEKAAYIYAHLLHDLNGAANVLQQGRMYREAAAIYKEHLKNLPMAAECLEKGGLLLDAIDIYLELERWEKAGDLYLVIGKKARADLQFERCVKAALDKADFLEASRLLIDKMGLDLRARKILLQGWHDAKQSEACLTRYFEILLEDPEVNWELELATLYDKHMPPDRAGSFLTVLSTQVSHFPEDGPRDVARSIAYELVSAQALQGNTGLLQLLYRFVARDTLIAGDVGRFGTMNPKTSQEPIRLPQLNKNIEWLGCTSLGSQLLAYGREGNHLWMARFNFQNHVEYYHWPEGLASDVPLRLLARGGTQGIAIIYQHGIALSKKVLPVNERFSSAVEVFSPNSLELEWASVAGLGLDAQGMTVALVQGPASTSLKSYDSAGQLRTHTYLKNADDTLFEMPPMHDWMPLIPCKKGLLMLHPAALICVNEHQQVKVHEFDSPTIALAVHAQEAICVVTTQTGAWRILTEEPMKHPTNPMRIGKVGSHLDQVQMLPGGLLVATTRQQEVEVYAFTGGNYELQMRANLDFTPVAIIPGPHRRTFCLLAADGSGKTFEVEESMQHWQ